MRNFSRHKTPAKPILAVVPEKTELSQSQLPKQPLWTRDYAIACFVNLASSMNFYLMMVITAAYAVDTWQADSGLAGIAASIFVVGAIISRGFSGKMIGFLGYKTSLFIGVGISVLASLLYILAPNIEVLIAVRLVHGFGFGVITSSGPALVADIIPNQRSGEGMGYFSLSATISSGIGPFLAMLLASSGNYPLIFICCALIMVAAFVVLPLLKVQRQQLLVVDKAELSGFKLRSIIELPVMPVSLVAMLIYFCFGGIVSFLALYMREIDLVEFASVFFMVFAVTVFVSRPLVGKIFDARGAKVIILPALAVLALGFVVFSQIQNHWMLVASAVIVGLGVGAVQAATLAVVAKITSSARKGVATTTYFLMCDVGYSIGPMLIGFCIPLLGFRGMYLSLAVVCLLNLGYYFLYSKNRQS